MANGMTAEQINRAAQIDRAAAEIDRKDAELLGMEDPTRTQDKAHEHEVNVYHMSHVFEKSVEWINTTGTINLLSI